MSKETDDRSGALAGPVERPVRPPAAWLSDDGNRLAFHKHRDYTRPLYEQNELSPDFTDTARAALLWVLWHHQGGSSPVGQPIRFALGMGAHEPMSVHQVVEAKRWGAMTRSETADFHRRSQADLGREEVR